MKNFFFLECCPLNSFCNCLAIVFANAHAVCMRHSIQMFHRLCTNINISSLSLLESIHNEGNVFLLIRREGDHMLMKPKMRRGCTVPSPQTWHSTKIFDGTELCATTGSMDGCNILPETQIVGTSLRVVTRRVL